MTEQQTFINKIAPLITAEAKNRGFKSWATIIAQAINESGWGKSPLAYKYHNYFGMKCGGCWKGKSVNMATKEEYEPGTLTSIRDNFRAYDSIEEGVKGYFDFINFSLYANLKTSNGYVEYADNLKKDGYATDSTYPAKLKHLVEAYNLTQWETGNTVVTPQPQPKPQTVKEADLQSAIDTLAQYVIKGYFGNGTARKDNLYKAIQSRVNEMVK